MAQETRNVDYESMVEKYMNEWKEFLTMQDGLHRTVTQ